MVAGSVAAVAQPRKVPRFAANLEKNLKTKVTSQVTSHVPASHLQAKLTCSTKKATFSAAANVMMFVIPIMPLEKLLGYLCWGVLPEAPW